LCCPRKPVLFGLFPCFFGAFHFSVAEILFLSYDNNNKTKGWKTAVFKKWSPL